MPDDNTTTLSPAQLEQRAQANVRHGARSEGRIRAVARTQKRRFLRQNGLRAGDVEGLGLAYLDLWARAQAKVELMDRWSEENGWLDDESIARVAIQAQDLQAERGRNGDDGP